MELPLYKSIIKILILFICYLVQGCNYTAMSQNLETVTLGGGCFWCVEAVYQDLKGIEKVVSGYSGGNVENPTYEQVSTGRTNHAEVVQITFNPQVMTYQKLLEIFFHLHDPTTLNRQGADTGTEYRSVIFYDTENQHQGALQAIKEIELQKLYSNKVVTQVVPLKKFYPAEDYQQNYYKNNPGSRYCQLVVAEKVNKARKLYHDLFKN